MPRTHKPANTPPLNAGRGGLRPSAGEKLSRAMIKSISGYAIILTDPDGLIISLNKGAEIILGYQEKELIGKSIAIFYAPETLPEDGPEINLEEARANNNYEVKGWRIKKDGTKFLANIRYAPLYDDERQLLGYTKTIHELPENFGADVKVKKIKNAVGANISFRKLIENSSSGITLLDKDLKIFYRSRSAERITGRTIGERLKTDLGALIHPEDEAKVTEVLNNALKSPGVPKSCTFRTRHLNGDYIWIDGVYTNFLDEPNVNAIVCNFIDASARKRADSLLEETVNELSAYKYALDESSIVAITDQKGVIQHVNDNFCKISKYSREELVGQDHRIINSSYHPKAFIKELWTTIANGKIWKGELKNKAKDGSLYWVDTTIVPFLNDHGKPYQYIAIRSDITERKLVQERITESERFIKTITDNLPALIAYWTADLHCLFANKPYAHWFGKQPNEMIGIRKENLIDKEEFRLHETHIAGVLGGQAQSFERNFFKPTGERIYTHTQYIPDKTGNVVKGFYSLIYDTTEVKQAEREILEKTSQIKNLLENILDGFIALDENRCYTYANKQIGRFLGVPSESLIGKCIWDVFPDLVGTAIYESVEKVYAEKISLNLEDYYAPLNSWQENRIYPHDGGVSIFIRDITKQKQEEHHLKLLESVITNTTDSIMITEAEPQDEPGPRILYINEAFTSMTGYTAADVIGQSPRLLQGPKTDRTALAYLHDCMRNWQHCEISVINYKKNGEEFWINISITPVADKNGWFTHWIAIERDITHRKLEEQRKALLAEISNAFNAPIDLKGILLNVLQQLSNFGDFGIGEVWLISPDRKKVNLVVKHTSNSPGMTGFYRDAFAVKSMVKGEGLPGIVWETGTIHFLEDLENDANFKRKKAAQKAGLKSAYGVPLRYKKELIGVLILCSTGNEKANKVYIDFFEELSRSLGEETKRKQLEEDLNQLFTWAPDIICTAGSDGYFKKVNPALINLLGYTELELLNRPLMDFIHPDDRAASSDEFNDINEGKPIVYFENRYVTRAGKTKWLTWATSAASPEGLIFCVAKDITDKKELADLLEKANTLARIGSWEIDLLKGTVYWSGITKEIHEVDSYFVPDLEMALSFYKEGFNRDFITYKIKEAIENGISWDVELQIVTAKGNDRWIRVICEAETSNNKCIRVYGSFQDIDARKRAEISVTDILEERNTILESIGDAFFAVDKAWTVTYWNNMAEKVLGKPKQEMLNRNLWDVFTESIDSDSYKKYHEAIAGNEAKHFEDYYPPLDKWYEISAYPSESGLAVYFKDVTDRKISDIRLKELNESLQIQTKELATSNAELEQFAFVASHDLQEPLRMVTSFLTQIERKYNDKLDEKGRQYINFAVDGAKRMRQIILDLLEFSKVGSMDDSLEDIDLNRLIGDISALYRKQIEEKSAAITYHHLPVIISYKTPVRQIFQNLISNSLKYTDAGIRPLIEVACRETKKEWQLSVKDNGIGIEREYFDKIFIIFQRLHNKDEYSGTGMGLAIAKKIVENLGGRIWIESEKGKGSTFYFTIIKQ